ncbi:ClC family H(+)/Cl(-) exchange transporter [Thomasclavelia sp.]|uniref:ClC family H(+)/Cl(-) exchange transporter n=1 Tax=Thomasclavelia sp. TaxID=3025757 RepID=UPI0025E4247A|nr:ClC family H(+)/Cl(-) exchange transporter [Thomasclavelia sp.]
MKKTLTKLLDSKQFKLILLFEGLLAGIVAGGIVIAYRIALSKSASLLLDILAFCKNSIILVAIWFVVLVIIAKIVSKLLNLEPLISGSGIPQLEGELSGKIDANWYRVLLCKFVGGFLSSLAGLALGREGPSIQLGAMSGKGVGRILKRSKTEERYLLTCGASAGLAAAFHAPLAGVMFALEEIHKHFSAPLLIAVMTSSITADYLMTQILGMEPVFSFNIQAVLPTQYYWMLLILGVVLGILGAFYNKSLLFIQGLYQRFNLSTFKQLLIPFMLAGILGFTVPELIGNGDTLVDLLTEGKLSVSLIIIFLIGKFLFAQISFGSGAPGGIFFPLLVIGCLIGGLFGNLAHLYLGLDASYINNFVLLAMAGYFTAIVRAPVTGIILIFEMTGSLNHLLSLTLVTIVSYIVADLLKAKPIYESLLENLIKKRNFPIPKGVGEKVLLDFMIVNNSPLQNHCLKEINWPPQCLIVSLQRDGNEFIPRGQTYLKSGDSIIVMCDKNQESMIYDQISALINQE